MRTWLYSCVAAACFAVAATGAYAMGGTGGGYSNMQVVPTGPGSQSDYTVAVRLIKHDNCQDALPHLFGAMVDMPKNADVLNYLGYCERKVGSYDASLTYYNQALAINPNHKGVHEYLGELYLQMHRLDDANKELTTLASLCPDGCDERDTLAKAIAAYQPPTAATPPAAAPSGAPTGQ